MTPTKENTVHENRCFLRNFGGDPANFYHEKALFGMGDSAKLTLWLPPETVPDSPGAGITVMVELALGPDVGEGPLNVDVTWAGEPLATVSVNRKYRRHRFFIPRERLSGELDRLGIRLQLDPAHRKSSLRGRVRSLSFRTLRAAGTNEE